MTKFLIAALPGDGIGPEVVGETQLVCDKAAQIYGFELQWRDFPFGADYYLKHQVALPDSALNDLGECQAMLLGAVGDPTKVKPGPLEQELLLALRFHFDQFLNLRPARSFPNVPVPVDLGDNCLDSVVIRENTEDYYMGLGGRSQGIIEQQLNLKRELYELSGQVSIKLNPAREAAFSLGIMTRPAVARITRKAGEMARARGEGIVHVATKANAVPALYGLWDEITLETLTAEFPELSLKPVNVDALCYHLVRHPLDFGVILCPNLFGDIISDLLSALAGGLGLGASGSIGNGLSTFEPVHGSAPGITGTGRANPLATILSGALMLNHLGLTEAARAVDKAVFDYLSGPDKPFELGGQDDLATVGRKITAMIK